MVSESDPYLGGAAPTAWCLQPWQDGSSFVQVALTKSEPLYGDVSSMGRVVPKPRIAMVRIIDLGSNYLITSDDDTVFLRLLLIMVSESDPYLGGAAPPVWCLQPWQIESSFFWVSTYKSHKSEPLYGDVSSMGRCTKHTDSHGPNYSGDLHGGCFGQSVTSGGDRIEDGLSAMRSGAPYGEIQSVINVGSNNAWIGGIDLISTSPWNMCFVGLHCDGLSQIRGGTPYGRVQLSNEAVKSTIIKRKPMRELQESLSDARGSFTGNATADTFSNVAATEHVGSRRAKNQGVSYSYDLKRCKRHATECLENDEPGHSFSTDKVGRKGKPMYMYNMRRLAEYFVVAAHGLAILPQPLAYSEATVIRYAVFTAYDVMAHARLFRIS
ncbi:hypothetical protein Tco_1359607 [Tanacetum coccineum]